MNPEALLQRTARCACQSAIICVQGAPEMHGVCHCNNCQRRTGSAFGISTYFSISQVIEKRGEMKTYAFHHETQNHDQSRHFCNRCGTTLYWTVSTLPGLIGIAGGCFAAEAPLCEPTMSVCDGNRKSWVTLPETWKRAELG